MDMNARTHNMDYESLVKKQSITYRVGKRFFDIVLCLAAMFLLIIVAIPISIATWLEDGFPVFFTQERTGWNGKVFRMYKFRSMCRNAQQMHFQMLEQNELDGPAFKMKEDPRITKVGKFLRKTSLDELPQIINILKGEMSIVGPRPLPTYEAEKCNSYQKQRTLVKPGLTCYWQCMGRDDIPFDEWIELDLKYIREAILWTDLKIIFMTFGAVVRKEGAY